MKLLFNSTYNEMLDKIERGEKAWDRVLDLQRTISRHAEEESNRVISEKFTFGTKIQRAIIGSHGTGKTMFLKHIAKNMPHKCRAFNFGDIDEFNDTDDAFAELRKIPNPTIDEIVHCCVQSPVSLLNLIDNVRIFGIDEGALIKALHRAGAEFIITSTSAPRIENAKRYLDFVYAYPTVEDNSFASPGWMKSRTFTSHWDRDTATEGEEA